MPYGITQCYLPPGSGDFPALTPAEAGTQTNSRSIKNLRNMTTGAGITCQIGLKINL